MFEVTATGKNMHYGKPGERVLIANNQLVYCIREGWVEGDKVVFVPHGLAKKREEELEKNRGAD